MSEEPTREQIRWLLEWCGLHHNKPTGGYFWDKDERLVLDMHNGEEGIDLSFLFEYAIPKLFEMGYDYRLWSDDGYH